MVSSLMKVIKEGSATVNFPKEVFYNPVQEFNRDLTITMINRFNKCRDKKLEKDKSEGLPCSMNILEALSATGLRSVRFANEIKNVNKITANDIDPIAAELIKKNVEMNNVSDKINVNCGDANLLMYTATEKFHVVDIDPYGSASPFLDASVQSLKNGGLLCVTCTDAAVLCGSSLGTSMGKYGAVTVGSKLASSHEMGIRILLQSIQSAASRHGLYIEPLLSLSIDFYFRVFVRVWDGPGVVKGIASKLGMIFVCVGCNTYHIQPLATVETLANTNRKVHNAVGPVVGQHCEECKGRFNIAGPIWIDPIHNVEFCNGAIEDLNANVDGLSLTTKKRIIGMVSLASEELSDVPLYYELDKLARTVRSVTPACLEFRSALLHAGYRVSSSHCAPTAIKTDAPPHMLWNILRCYSRQHHSEHVDRILNDEKTSSYCKTILTKPADDFVANFTKHNNANPQSRSTKLLRFQANPMPNWGPKPKASKFSNDDE